MRLGQGLQFLDDLALWGHADGFVSELTALEIKESRNALDTELGSETAFVIDIYFADLDGSAFITGDFIKDGSKHFTWAAPFGPEIDEDRDIGLKNFGYEVVRG